MFRTNYQIVISIFSFPFVFHLSEGVYIGKTVTLERIFTYDWGVVLDWVWLVLINEGLEAFIVIDLLVVAKFLVKLHMVIVYLLYYVRPIRFSRAEMLHSGT